MHLTNGSRLGPYELTTLLGAGGMGEVYRARDSKLGRDVAIKVLRAAFLSDADLRMRFEREARMLAALNHPNIATIYGVEEVSGATAIVMELVEGDTLSDRLRKVSRPRSQSQSSGLPVADALAIARQIADALEAAHERSIVHRDLKPANIKITSGGVVKVLDFGLAKVDESNVGDTQVDSDALANSPTLATHPGILLGTAAYMSPEQARGGAVDKRTDIWAFGCVLYELLTGRMTFSGGTVSDIVVAVLQREPDWSALPAALPPSTLTLLRRCLEKDPKRRLRDIGDARIELDDIVNKPLSAAPRADAAVSTPGWRKLAVVGVAIAALIALAFAFWPRPKSEDTWVNPLANARFTRFTDFPGTETLAAISPDGKSVAFLSDHDRQFDLWLGQVGTGRFANLTKDLSPLGLNYIVAPIGFSGDGTEVWFPGGTRRMLMALTGGTPRVFLPEYANHPSWSPDGMQMVYFNAVDGDPMFVADRTGANAHEIFKDVKGVHNHNPVWSTDGKWIYFVHGTDNTDQMDIWRIRPTGGTPERLTEQHATVNFLAPLNTRTLLYVSPAEDRSGPWLWALDVDRKVTHRVSSGLEQYTSVSASADGRRVVATVANPISNLWSVPLLDHLAEESDVKPFPMPTVRALGPRFRSKSLFYLSAHGTGEDGLWRLQDGQAAEIWKGSDGALGEPGAPSPDERRVVVILRREGRRHLTIMSADGSEPRALSESIDAQGTADWSPDGNWIVSGGTDAQGPGLFKIPVEGGTPIRLAKGVATNPVWSSDGTLIAYLGPVVGGREQLLAVRPDGTAVELPQVQVPNLVQIPHRFVPDGKALVYVQAPSRPAAVPNHDFWLLDLATKKSRQLTHFTDRSQLRSFDFTPDGRQIVFDRTRENSDIVLIELPR